MKLVSWFLRANEKGMREAALVYERSRSAGAALSVQAAHREALQALAAASAILVGFVERGEELRVRLDTFDRHNVILGATGSG